MAFQFKISGDIVRDGDEWAGVYTFSPAMLDDLLAEANGEDLFIDINSVGGNVDAGLTMYSRLRRYASEKDAEVTTRTDGYVASIATAIFLAGDVRIVNEFMQPFVHNPSVNAFVAGMDAEELEEMSKDLERTQSLLAAFYAKNTKLSEDEALALMDDDTWITAQDCIKYGFATEIEELSNARANLVASLKSKIFSKTKKVEKMSKKQTLAQKLAKAVLGIGADEKENKKILDAAQKEIDFPNVDADAAIAIGDKANVDGKVAEGEFTIPSPEDADKTWKLTFEAGVLTGIDKEAKAEVDTNAQAEVDTNAQAEVDTNAQAEVDTNAQAEEIASLKDELKKVKSTLAQLQAQAVTDTAKIAKYEDALNKIAAIEPEAPTTGKKREITADRDDDQLPAKGSVVRAALKDINFELKKN